MTEPTVQPSEHATVRSVADVLCSPPYSTGDTRAKRVVDLLLPTGWWRCPFFIAIAVGVSAASHLPILPGLVLGAVVTLVASAYCLLNFWRCREAHCIVSGIGWAALGLFEIVEIAIGHSLIGGDEGLAFVVVLVVAIAFEVVWRMRYGTNAVSTSA